MDDFIAFLKFETFISSYALIIIYYIGALVVPYFIWKYIFKLKLNSIASKIPYLSILFISMFLFTELLWRICFEYLLAFMQMHDALIK